MLLATRALIVLASVATVVACAGAPQPGQTPITEAEIQALNDEWLRGEREDDGMRAAAGYTSDAILVTVRGRVDGQAMIQQFWSEAFAAQPGSAETRLQIIKWDASGDIGYVVGRFEGGVTARAGHWLAVVQRQQDGSLRTVAQISIPDPAPAQ